VTPLVPSDDTDEVHAEAGLPLAPLAPPVLEATQAVELLSGASEIEHKDAARKQRIRRKRAVDSALRPKRTSVASMKAQRSSRVAAKEDPKFVTMLSKEKSYESFALRPDG
jgi:hypothetical protein